MIDKMMKRCKLTIEDLEGFIIPCTNVMIHFSKVLCYLGAGINLVPLFLFKMLGSRAPKSTTMRLLMDDHTIKKQIRVP